MSSKPVYILGTGLSHNGSSCLLKDGKILVAIEKERLSRIKHDGGNDSLTIQYCLNYAGITLHDLSLVVQCANFEKEEIQTTRYRGPRLFPENYEVPVVTISHHLAHAYSAVGTCPFHTCDVFILDGAGSPYAHCDDLAGAIIPADVNSLPGLYCEKDSYYHFDGQQLHSIYKDFSLLQLFGHAWPVHLPTNRHSIGGLYSMVSEYCFGNLDDAGKLMGLAPYGRDGQFQEELFRLEDGRLWVNEGAFAQFNRPMHPLNRTLKDHFQYFADIARWTQQELERAVLYIIQSRQSLRRSANLAYAGGVALNAVANARIKKEMGLDGLYMEPAAGDNGLAPGCAYYGWLALMKKERVLHSGNAFFGRPYRGTEVEQAIAEFKAMHPGQELSVTYPDNIYEAAATLLAAGKTIGWFQGGSEYGPRALGHRSILADPRRKGVKELINRDIKFREDFRPFAPSVPAEDAGEYFEEGWDSPYMILVDRIRPEWKAELEDIVHCNGTCRVQTVTAEWNAAYYQLLQAFKKRTGIAVLLNTSFNRKGMPIVETPAEAIGFFYECALDVLVMNDCLIEKQADN